MKATLRSLLSGKRVLILGYGREGRSTFRWAQEAGGWTALDVADQSAAIELPGGHRLISGPGYLDALEDYDLVFKTPGIVLPKPPSAYRCAITSQVELFLGRYRDQVIGITGTKGKSTTSTLLYHVLKKSGMDCLLGGNIGVPVLDLAGDVGPDTAIVLELSCHQLEYCSVSPARAMLLNLYEDHLDHYGTFENYIRAKRHIYLNQRPTDILWCGSNALPPAGACPSRVVEVAADVLPFRHLSDLPGVRLRGEHNRLNCAFVWLAARELGVTEEQFLSALESYRPLPHRLELLGSLDGVDYYDDSISTTAESAMSAVNSVPNASILLLGGMDRGIEYDALVDFLLQSPLSDVVLMYASGKRLQTLVEERGARQSGPRFHLVEDLSAAVAWVKANARPGAACILSPAAASYGYFKNFEERGDAFKSLVFGA